jgi:DNA-binding MarR family transcriptional regulator
MRERTAEGELATQVILAAFRVNGLLIAAGDTLAGPDGLTSARWQVLGPIAMAEHPLTVPQIARRMGLTRQSVHTTIRRLATDGLVELCPNTDHRRSPLVRMTAQGQTTYRALQRRQAAWVNTLAAGLGPADLQTTARVLHQLCERLETDTDDRLETDTDKEEDRHDS